MWISTFTLTVLGKGRRVRVVPFSRATAEAPRRCLRTRKSPLPDMWISARGQELSDSGIRQMLDRIAPMKIRPHQFRHSFAHRWLLNAGQEAT